MLVLALPVTASIRWLLHICGFLLIYAALLYEDEEHRIQSKLEALWVQLKDKQEASQSWIVSFLQMVAKLTGKVLDRVFGERLLSIRFLVVSIYLSLASFFLFMAIALKIAPNPKAGSPHENLILALLFGASGLSFALTDNKLFRLFWWVAAVAIPLLKVTPFLLFVLAKTGFTTTIRGVAYVATPFVVSLACDLAYITLTRKLLRRAAEAGSLVNISLIALVNLASWQCSCSDPFYSA
jgi:hypothetical protein